MSVVESIVKNLQGLPNAKLIEVARYVQGLSEEAREDRRKTLQETFGCLSEEDGQIFEEALADSRRIES